VKPRWIVNAPVDLLVGCGGWTAPLLLLTYVAAREWFVGTLLVFYALMIVCNNPHYMATLYRAYGTRDDFVRYRFFTVHVTALVAATAVVAHFATGLVPWLVTAYLTWSPWHYTGQNFGLAMMWARRNGAEPTRPERGALQGAFAASYLGWLLWMHSGYSEEANVLSLGLPPAIATPLRGLLVLVFLAAGTWVVARLARRAGFVPLLGVATLYATQFLWFVLPTLIEFASGRSLPPAYYSAGVLAFMHCAQYLWVTSFYARRETEAGVRGDGRPWNPWRYYAILVAGGIALFVPGPWLVSTLFRHDLVDSLVIFAALVNLHHFIVDGAVWKLREGRVAALLIGSRHTPVAGRAPTASPLLRAARWIVAPTPGARALRWSTAAALLAVAAADQAQYFLTLDRAGARQIEAAAALNPHDSRVRVRRAELLADAGRVPEAVAELRDALDLNPRSATALRMLGSLLVQNGRYAEAAAHYDMVERRIRPDVTTLQNVAVLSARAGDARRAEEKLREALRLYPDRADVHLNLAEVYLGRGALGAAVPHYATYLALTERAGGGDPRLRALVLLKLGEALAMTGRPLEARAALTRAAALADGLGAADLAAAARARLTSLPNP
jgi:tetratricopeptide (TPR) repeat protein